MRDTFAVAPNVLIWAREECWLSRQEAANKLKVDLDQLVAIEAGQAQPSVSLLQRMAKSYHVSLPTLLLGEPPALKKPEDYRTLRGQAPTLSRGTVQAIKTAQRWQEDLSDLVAEDPTLYHRHDLPFVLLDDDPVRVAAIERQRLAISIEDQLRWKDAREARDAWRWRVESIGILVFVVNMRSDDCRGFSLLENDYIPAIVLNGAENEEAQTFTLFHEYAHLLLRQAGICNQRINVVKGNVEGFCNRFAANVLMPVEAVCLVFGVTTLSRIEPFEPTIEDLDNLARKFKVSKEALALRLEELSIAPAGYYIRYLAALESENWKHVRCFGRGRGGYYHRRYLNRLGHRYVSIVVEALRKGLLDPVGVSELLDAKAKHINALEADLAALREKYAATSR